MVKAKKYVTLKHFKGTPKRSDFQIVEEELPPLKNGEILVKTEWVSVDHYHHVFNAFMPVPHDQGAYQVAVVVESKNADFPVGTRVVTHRGWRDYTVLNPNLTDGIDIKDSYPFTSQITKAPDLHGLSPSLLLGTLGNTGLTAYFGFLEICKPKAGDTVVVTGAAGAVGSVVGQIAKIKGCKVIGFAGSDAKVKWLEKELGFDKAYNYKTVNILKALQEAAPDGVDSFFDNVGGEISSLIISQMKKFGKISVCGYMSTYGDEPTKVAPVLQQIFVAKQLKMEGFQSSQWVDQWPDAVQDLIKWVASGQIIAREHVTEGFENIYDAFIGMLEGENTGKAVVKLT